MSLLSAQDLRYRVLGRDVLVDVWLDVQPGERIAVSGPSGSGKTSLLALLAGLVRPESGSITYDGAPVTGVTPGIGLVLQGYGLLPLLTAAENIEAALRAGGTRPATAIATAQQALDRVQLGDHADHLVEELSGGQQQRVAVARGLALQPRVLLADEPTAEQDAGHRGIVVEALIDAVPADGALLIATHDPEIAALCDRTVVLHDGRRVDGRHAR